VFVRRNLITILLSIEIMLNAVNLSFVAFGRALGKRRRPIIVFFVMTVAAAEAAVGLANRHRVCRHRESLNPDHVAALKWWRVLLLIPLLPSLGFLVNAGRGRRLRNRGGAVACAR
jgi:NADH-quinone oxidoreductase subunit K